MLSRSLSYAKIVQGECRTSSLLERYAEVKPILYKEMLRMLFCSCNAERLRRCVVALHHSNNKKYNEFMSVNVKVRTTKRITPDDVLARLSDGDNKLVVTSNEFPTLQFGILQKAIRGIMVSEEDNGYEVRVCSMASHDDYQLFVKTILTIMALTSGKAYLEDEDDAEVADPQKQFDSQWMDEQTTTSIDYLRLMAGRGHEITLFGLFSDICIGPKLFAGFDIPLAGAYERSCAETLMSYLCAIQWHCAGLEGTGTHMQLTSPNDETGKKLTATMITINEGNVKEFDYVTNADVLGFFDFDNKDASPVFVPFRELWKVLPQDKFDILDELQYKRTAKLTADDVRKMMELARRYEPYDLYHDPVRPGKGFDKGQRTFILMWNPAISSVRLEDHQRGLENIFTEYFNWSVWDYEKARCGDRFFLVRVGEGRTGIVMSGVFDSHPYKAEDWSGRGRPTFYMDMLPNVIVNPDKAPMLQTAQLAKAIPTFDWAGGHSGRLLSQEEAQALESLWEDYLENNKNQIDGVRMSVNWHETFDD